MESPEPATSAAERGKLFVGGISSETGEEVLREHFAKYGEIGHVAVIRDRLTGNGRGFAFVQFADPDLAEKALDESEIDKHVILGRTVEVKRAIPRSTRPNLDPQFPNLDPNHPLNPTLNPNYQTLTDPKSKKIFVGGLRDNITDLELRNYFEKFGTMNDAVVMKDKWTKRSRGFGFVTFDSESSVQKVLETSLHDLNGRMVEVKIAVPKGEHVLNNINGNNEYIGNEYDGNNNEYNFDMRAYRGMGFGYPSYKLGFMNNYYAHTIPYGGYNYGAYRGGYVYGPMVNRVRGGPMGFGGYYGGFGGNGGYFGNYAGLEVGSKDVAGVSLQLDSVKLDAQ